MDNVDNVDNPFDTKLEEGEQKVTEEVKDVPVVENVLELTRTDAQLPAELKDAVEANTAHAAQLRVVAEVTSRLEACSKGRVEAEIGLEEDYWKVRNELNMANRRLEELR